MPGVGRLGMVAFSFPNPITWTIDKANDLLGGVAENAFELIISGLTAWVIDALVWIVGGVFNFFFDATDPNVEADWFVGGDGPYAMTAAIGATLLVGFVLAGITQGVLSGDTTGMLRRMALDLPVSVLGMVGLVTVTQALVRLVDELSGAVLDAFSQDVAAFSTAVTSLSLLSGGVATAFVIFLLGLVAVLAGIVLVAELVVRAALVYVVVALAPLVFAARLWPSLAGGGRKLLELLTALVVSKLVIAVALAVAAAAAVGVGSGGEVQALPAPEVFAEDPGGSVTNAVGLLLAATAAFGVAAFSPLLVARLFPIAEAALVAQGVRGGPVRASQQAITLGYYTRYARSGSARQGQLASAPLPGGPPPGAAAPGGASGAGAGASAGAGAGAGAAAAAGAATRAASSGKEVMTATATATGTERGAEGKAPGSPKSGWRARPASGAEPPIGPGGRTARRAEDSLGNAQGPGEDGDGAGA